MLAMRTRVPGTVSFGDVFGTYPASGFPSLVNSGAVSKGMYRGPVPHGMLPRRLNGLGDMVDLSGYFDSIGSDPGSIDSGGGGFFDTLGQTAIDALPGMATTAERIALARYAVPPPGTLIKTPTSMVYTQPSGSQGASLLSAGGLLSGGLGGSLMPIILIAAVALVAMKA
jgi:hypothetical protein